MHGITISPTGTCFEDASLFFIHLIKEKPSRISDSDFCMVHAICDRKDLPPYSHEQALQAAIENGDRPPPWEIKYLRLCKDFSAAQLRL